MNKILNNWLRGLLSLALAASVQAQEPKILHVYNWSDYIAGDTLAGFTRETGIRVVYDVFDSNEVLEARLMAGASGFDLVVPSLDFLGRQIQAGVFQPLDRSQLPNLENLDAELMARIAQVDGGNRHAVPYLWGTTGIGYNVARIAEILGEDAPTDSWDLVLDPDNLSQLRRCGVAFLDTPSEVIPIVLNYLGEDPNSTDTQLIRSKARAHLLKLRPHITYFHSSQLINDLANGEICVALGWSGDILQAADRAEEAGRGVQVAYSIPKEGAPMWFDMLAIPRDARHPRNAHAFINYLLRPEVMAEISNHVWYANAVPAARARMDAGILEHPGIYPAADTTRELFTLVVRSPAVERAYTRVWTEVKTGR